jgi:uncharacterized membrane protein YedE/YeeE
MAPFDLTQSLGHWGLNGLYVLCGVGFGFALERAGFGNSTKLAAQFYFYDMRVLKVMFTAILTAMVLIFWCAALGWLDYSKLYVPETYLWPGIVGGFIFGMGFVLGGYCPGTALVSTATLKLDGLVFVLGMGVGMFLFGETVDYYRVWWETSGFYGDLRLPDLLRVDAGVVAFGVVVMALGMFYGAEKLEKYLAARKAEGGN